MMRLKGIVFCCAVTFIAQARQNEIGLDPVTITATPQLQRASATGQNITNISSEYYNKLPAHLAAAIQDRMPQFEIRYRPDYRQEIADNWPASIDDSQARADWGWKPQFGFQELTRDMLYQIFRASVSVTE